MAKMIVRRHRLAEKLLQEVLQIDSNEMDSTAYELEHILGPEVTESIFVLSSDILSSVHMVNKSL